MPQEDYTPISLAKYSDRVRIQSHLKPTGATYKAKTKNYIFQVEAEECMGKDLSETVDGTLKKYVTVKVYLKEIKSPSEREKHFMRTNNGSPIFGYTNDSPETNSNYLKLAYQQAKKDLAEEKGNFKDFISKLEETIKSEYEKAGKL